MPPKAKAGKGDAKKTVEEEEPDEEEKELMERELVINYLKSKLGKFQSTSETLEDENLKLSKELEVSRINLRDINEFLTNELKARSLTSAALEQKLMELQEEMEKMQQEFQEAARRLTEDKDAEISRLQDDLEEMKQKGRTVEQYLLEKRELEARLSELETGMEEMKDRHARDISNIERRHVEDKDRWKKEMAQKIKETKAQMMKLTDNQLEVTTKRTIMENEQMSSELSYQSRQTEKLLEKNRKLLEENGDYRRQVDLYKQTETELAKRNHVYQKTIKTLLGKLKLSGAQRHSDEEQLGDMEGAIGELYERARHAEMAVGEKVHEVAMLTEALRKNQDHLGQLEGKYDDTANFLTACLHDVKRKIVTITRGDGGNEDSMNVQPGRLDELGLEQREMALTYLLERLHVYQATAGGMHAVSSGAALFTPPFGPAGLAGREGQIPGGISLPPIVTPPQYQAQAGGTRRGGGGGVSASLGDSGWADGGASVRRESEEEEAMYEGEEGTGASAEQLMGKLLTDVRPWGGKAKDTVRTGKNRGSTFLKKGAGIHSGSVNSTVSYSQRFAA